MVLVLNGSTEVLSVLAKVHIRFETSPGLWDFDGFSGDFVGILLCKI